MLRKIRSQLQQQNQAQARAEVYRNLIRKEAKIGGTLFGTLPNGHRREFFCLDKHTWVWHEEWIDKLGQRHVRNTRYDVRPTGVVKIQDGRGYQALSPSEARNLRDAVRLYYQRVTTELYQNI